MSSLISITQNTILWALLIMLIEALFKEASPLLLIVYLQKSNGVDMWSLDEENGVVTSHDLHLPFQDLHTLKTATVPAQEQCS